MSLALVGPTPSTASRSASEAARTSSSPPSSWMIFWTTSLGMRGIRPEHPVAARGDREVEGVDLAVVAEQLGEAAEVEHVLVGQVRPSVCSDGGEVLLGVLDRVVADQRRLVGGDADHRLLELHLDQPALGAELDDVALDLDRHPGHQLGPLQDREHVVEDAAALELEHGQPRRRPGRAARGTCRASPGPGWPWPAPRGCPGGCTWSPRRRGRRRRGAGRSRSPARRSAWRRARRCGGGCRSRSRGSSGPASAARWPRRSWSPRR